VFTILFSVKVKFTSLENEDKLEREVSSIELIRNLILSYFSPLSKIPSKLKYLDHKEIELFLSYNH